MPRMVFYIFQVILTLLSFPPKAGECRGFDVLVIATFCRRLHVSRETCSFGLYCNSCHL